MRGTQTHRPTGTIGVLERKPFLAPELQRQCEVEQIAIRSLRHVDDLIALAVPRVCILAIESDQNAVFRFIREAKCDSHTACVVCIDDRQDDAVEWTLREIGAVSVIDRFIRGDELAAICRKLLKTLIQRVQKHESHV